MYDYIPTYSRLSRENVSGLCFFTRWCSNFCVRSSPLRGISWTERLSRMFTEVETSFKMWWGPWCLLRAKRRRGRPEAGRVISDSLVRILPCTTTPCPPLPVAENEAISTPARSRKSETKSHYASHTQAIINFSHQFGVVSVSPLLMTVCRSSSACRLLEF